MMMEAKREAKISGENNDRKLSIVHTPNIAEEDKLSNGLGKAFDSFDFHPDFSFFDRSNKAKADLRWKQVSLHIRNKHILKEVSGQASSGEVCALMGPSGAGKSSLLNVLAGRVIQSSTKKVSGEITVNQERINPKKFRKNIAYVLQEDFVFPTSTARESLEFSALLRLPRKTTKEERSQVVDSLLNALGLDHVQDTLVGSSKTRGLSGGEKKRVAIGVEIVTNPSILFLDEPTSGLDSFSAWKVVRILRCLAKTGAAVLCTIHQPSSEVFNSFDKVLMLSEGRVMYNGKVSEVTSVFAGFGYPIPQFTNPADYTILVAQTAKPLPQHNVDDPKVPLEINQEPMQLAATSELAVSKAGLFTQFLQLSNRELKRVVRDKGLLIANFGVTIPLNLIFGIVFMNSADPTSSSYSVDSNFGSLLVVLVSVVFGSAQAPLITFPVERGVMIREYQTGTYSALTYLLSKMVVEIPLFFLRAVLTLVITYWLIGFSGNFALFVLTLWLVQLTSASYAYSIGALVSDAKQGQEFAPLLLVPQLLFAGVFIPIAALPSWLQWVQYLCVLKYAVNLAAIIEFGDCSRFSGDLINQARCLQLLETNDVDEGMLWLYILVPALLFVLFRTLSLLVLVVRARYFTG